MSRKLNVAIVGPGFIGKQHYEAIRRLPNTEVIAIVDVNEDSANKFAKQYGIKHVITQYEDLFQLDDLDVVHICTPNFLHYPMAKMALENNVHVFCEKPLSLTVEESYNLKELALSKNVLHAVNLNYRSNVMVREMKHRTKHSIGELLLVKGEYIQDWLMYDTDYDWHFDPKLVGPSRTVADIGTHLFDLIQFTTDKKIKKVFANLITVYPVRYKREQVGETFSQEYIGEKVPVEIENEDAAIIICELEDGTKASVNLSQITGGFKNGLSLTLSGSKASLTWNQETSDRLIVGKRDEGNEMLYADAKYLDESVRDFISLPNGHAVGWADAFKNSIGEFYKHILGVQKSSSSYVDFIQGHELMKIVNACLISNKENRWVEIEED